MTKFPTFYPKLYKIYTDPASSGSYRSVEALYAAGKKEGIRGLTKRSVKDFLRSTKAYALYAGQRYKEKAGGDKVIAYGLNELFQADLADMTQFYPGSNKNARFILCVIDAFSRKIYLRPLRNKKGAEVTAKFESILKEDLDYKPPARLQTDRGKEFWNQTFKELCTRYGIMHFSVDSRTKASMAERYILELKKVVERHLYSHKTKRYVHQLNDFAEAHNNLKHSSLFNATPNSVTYENAADLFKKMYPEIVNDHRKKAAESAHSAVKFPVNTPVRIALNKLTFQKSHNKKWSSEVFLIERLLTHRFPIRYKLKTLDDDTVYGNFRNYELLPVKLPLYDDDDDDDYDDGERREK